jgi:hypothetical protein
LPLARLDTLALQAASRLNLSRLSRRRDYALLRDFKLRSKIIKGEVN